MTDFLIGTGLAVAFVYGFVDVLSGFGVTRLLLRRALRRDPAHLRGRTPVDCGEGVDRPDYLVGYGPQIRPATLALTLEEALGEKRERRIDDWRAQGEGYRPMAVAHGARLVPPSGGTGVRRRDGWWEERGVVPPSEELRHALNQSREERRRRRTRP